MLEEIGEPRDCLTWRAPRRAAAWRQQGLTTLGNRERKECVTMFDVTHSEITTLRLYHHQFMYVMWDFHFDLP